MNENQLLIESLDITVANLRATNEADYGKRIKNKLNQAGAAIKTGAENAKKKLNWQKYKLTNKGRVLKNKAIQFGNTVKDASVKGGKAVAGKWNNLSKAGKIGAGVAATGALAGAAALAARRKKAQN